MFCTYILHSPSYDKYYIGSTQNLQQRVDRHNKGLSSYTRPYRPWIVACYEEYSTRSEAVARERYLKSLKDKKLIIRLVQSHSGDTGTPVRAT